MILKLFLMIVLIAVASVTAASEISLIAVSRLRLRRKAAEGSRRAKMILKILEMPERFFGTILVANNIVDALIAVLVTAVVIHLLGGESSLAIIISTVVASGLIIMSEVTAKTIATQHAERAAWMLVRPIQWLITLFAPIVKVFEAITQAFMRVAGIKVSGKPALITEDEVKALIKISGEEGSLQKEKYMMLSRVFDFSESVVRNVMTPRDKIVAISIDDPLDKIVDRTLESGYSRLPVYKDRADKFVGIISMKDLLTLSAHKDLVVLQDIVYPPTFVPGSKKVSELLKEFQKGHTHLALVVDEKGRVEGLVTIEDLLEEIVGEIKDESDVRAS